MLLVSLTITEHNPLQAVTWNNPNFDNNEDLTADVADTMHDNSTQILAIKSELRYWYPLNFVRAFVHSSGGNRFTKQL